jgi:glycosyltransferase involved in cell wall biosynthesis
VSNDQLAICIPTYNRQAQLRGCLESLLSQVAEEQLTIYISDNASTDQTARVVSEFQQKYPRIIYHRNQTNLGPDGNFTQVLKMASTHYAWLLGDDDRLVPGAVKTVVQAITGQSFDLVVVNGGRRQKGGVLGRVAQPAKAKVYENPDELLTELGWHMTWMSCLIFSRQLITSGDFQRYFNSNFLQMLVIFNYLAGRMIRVLWQAQPLVYNNNYNPPAWYAEIFEIFGRKWSEQISNLPPSYSAQAKADCVKAHGVKSHLFSPFRLLLLRLLGHYNLKTYQQYGQLIPRLTDVSRGWFWLIAILPVPRSFSCWFERNYAKIYKLWLRLN